jgi:hypothetical protein
LAVATSTPTGSLQSKQNALSKKEKRKKKKKKKHAGEQQ